MAAPLPLLSPVIGTGVVPVLGYIFPFQEKDKISPPPLIGAAGLVTDNRTRGFGVGADLFLKQDHYELRSFYAHDNINYDLYGVGFANGNSDVKVPLKQTGQIFFNRTYKGYWMEVFCRPALCKRRGRRASLLRKLHLRDEQRTSRLPGGRSLNRLISPA